MSETASTNRPANMTKVGHQYVVRTQAGYRKALNDFLQHAGWSLNELVDQRQIFSPYPAVVTFDTFYNGGTYALVHTWISAADYKNQVGQILLALDPA